MFGVGRVVLDAAESRHARQVMRLRSGDAVEVFDGAGALGVGRIAEAGEIERDAARRAGRRDEALHVDVREVHRAALPAATLTLVVAGCKGARLDWLVEKCTELDVTRIVLAEFARSVVHVGVGHVAKLSRAAIEACKQCRRLWRPTIAAGQTLDAVVSELASCAPAGTTAARLLVADPRPGAEALVDALHGKRTGDLNVRGGTPGASDAAGEVVCVIGPEGGLTTAERERLRACGARFVTLGPNVLRVETAAICVVACWSAHVAEVRADSARGNGAAATPAPT